MLFNTTQFFIFLIVVLILLYATPRAWRKFILLAASYYFYASWNPKFIALLLTLTVIDYSAGLWISRAAPERKKLALILSLSANLGFLGFFKYYNFAAETLVQLLRMPSHAFALDIVLPLGISFHTFQSMSYVVDVYRGEQEAITNPFDYALFICFFPQLVAGPIVRAREFFGDLLQWRPPSNEDVSRGVFLLMLGLTKKMAFADQFAQVADGYFKNVAGNPGMLTAWTGTFAFAMQIFFDFSGYTDMAIGMAKLIGFHFPVNFRQPYLAASITDFWRRWHISLSRWLRDYLYIPLGGNRRGDLMTYRNLMLTMLLGGLWHGASWNFVIWGGYHGALLSIERLLRGNRPETAPRWWLYPLRAVLTFGLVSISWVFFRAATLADSFLVIGQMFTGVRGTVLLNTWQFGLVAAALLLAIAEEKWEWFDRVSIGPAWAYAAGLTSMLLCLELFGVTDVTIPFVYFQF
jgi:alginate O-acetyltransferase complex protein AlgI